MTDHQMALYLVKSYRSAFKLRYYRPSEQLESLRDNTQLLASFLETSTPFIRTPIAPCTRINAHEKESLKHVIHVPGENEEDKIHCLESRLETLNAIATDFREDHERLGVMRRSLVYKAPKFYFLYLEKTPRYVDQLIELRKNLLGKTSEDQAILENIRLLQRFKQEVMGMGVLKKTHRELSSSVDMAPSRFPLPRHLTPNPFEHLKQKLHGHHRSFSCPMVTVR
jgi:hypothetical protein